MQMLLCCSRVFLIFRFFFFCLFLLFPLRLCQLFPVFHFCLLMWQLIRGTSYPKPLISLLGTQQGQNKINTFTNFCQSSTEKGEHTRVSWKMYEKRCQWVFHSSLCFSRLFLVFPCVNLIDWHHLSVRTTKNMYICTYVSEYIHNPVYGRKNKGRERVNKWFVNCLPSKNDNRMWAEFFCLIPGSGPEGTHILICFQCKYLSKAKHFCLLLCESIERIRH